jgi:hypothetical protein
LFGSFQGVAPVGNAASAPAVLLNKYGETILSLRRNRCGSSDSEGIPRAPVNISQTVDPFTRRKLNMHRHAFFAPVFVAVALAVPVPLFAGEAYEVSGDVVEVTGDTFVLQQDGQKWAISVTPETKLKGGQVEVGKKATVQYELVAKGVQLKKGAKTAKKAASPIEKAADKAVESTAKAVKSPDKVVEKTGEIADNAVEKTGEVAGKVLDVPAKAVGKSSEAAGRVLEVPGQAVTRTGEFAGETVEKTAEAAGKVIKNPLGAAGTAVRKTGEAVEKTTEEVMGKPE